MKNKDIRKVEAKERQKDYDSLTISQKIIKLDLKLGGGKGAVRERRRLGFKLSSEAEIKLAPKKPEKKPYQKPKRS